MENYETFSTTADVGIRIRGNGYGGLFQSAVTGLNLLYFDDQKIPGNSADSSVRRQAFEFHGDGPENVLVNLLDEVVYLLQTHERITTGIEIKEVSETHVKADLLTIPCESEPELEIKSVTYHNLEVTEQNGMKYAEVIFDV
ncbi:MAG: archease [bacterium]|nr:archease [bacterium]